MWKMLYVQTDSIGDLISIFCVYFPFPFSFWMTVFQFPCPASLLICVSHSTLSLGRNSRSGNEKVSSTATIFLARIQPFKEEDLCKQSNWKVFSFFFYLRGNFMYLGSQYMGDHSSELEKKIWNLSRGPPFKLEGGIFIRSLGQEQLYRGSQA